MAKPIELVNGKRVGVHLMAEQEYCEVKVDLQLRHPEVTQEVADRPEFRTQADRRRAGKIFHAAMAAPAESIRAEDIPVLVSSGRPFTLVESMLEGSYNQLRFAGRPDALRFDGRGKAWIIEHKVPTRRNAPCVLSTRSDFVPSR